MIVDDEQDVRDFLTAILERQNIQIRTAASKEEAIQAFDTFHPAIVLLDMRLGGSSMQLKYGGGNVKEKGEGLELLKLFKEKEKSVKVIMATGVDDESVIEEAKELGADNYITKPFNLEYIEGEVRRMISDLFLSAQR